ncbi:RagB/SusD family nutrient uptake outer membrane protein [Carboxylicivirga sp. N1Y90]|uniref:RagB/SusD family nutrient uptake outer membrane protein n=1 Tax=Carboxylicivirga fragile TaxID=3417571 RepID=UPI003D337B89|nr:RagB/SusD family nutrient uptake outer membrane protein [Marinilabiliaceae bacterium N1Y90]
MKNITSNIIMIGLVLVLSGCDNYLDITPTDSIDDSKAFETIEDLEKGMIGVYAMLGNSSAVALSSRGGDDVRLSSQNRGQGIQVHNWTYNAGTSDVGAYWTQMYFAIDRANRMLAVAKQFDAEDDIVIRVRGEALFVRAWAHFELAYVYCKNYDAADPKGLPYMKESVISLPARLSQGVVFQNILDDLSASLPLLSGIDRGSKYISENAIYALRARIALHMRNWDDAILYSSKVIDESGIRIATIEEIGSVWDDENADGVEVIFKMARSIGEGNLGDIFTDSSNGDIYFSPGTDLMAQYDTDDVRHSVYFGVDASGNDVVAKHNGRPDQPANLVDVKVFRVSEMYLLRCEAYAEKSMWDESMADINLLRENRITSPEEVLYGTRDNALKAIREERRRELAYEGFRFFDLKRWGLPIERTPEDSELASNDKLPAGNYRFVMPIPQAEIFANTNMKQNDGYENN